MTLQELSKKLRIPVDWLRVVFAIESGNNPRAMNPYTRAVGLIQFMPFVISKWGFTPDTFPRDYNTQLEYVYKYLQPFSHKIKSVTDLYLAVFYPAAIGKKNDFVIGSEVSPARAVAIAKVNPGFKAMPIRKRDVQRKVFEILPKVGLSKNKYYLQKATKLINI